MASKFQTKIKKHYEANGWIVINTIKLSVNGSDSDKKELYNETIIECVDLIDVQLNECTIDEKNTLLQVKDKLLRYQYNSDNFTSEMSKINYLKTTLI